MKYIFIDIDGTLYSTKINGIPYSAMSALKQAKANGHKLFVCTGRSLSAAKLFLNLDVDGFVFGAGELIYVDNKKKIYENPIGANDVLGIVDAANECNLGYVLEGSAGSYYSENAKEQLIDYFAVSAKTRKDAENIVEQNGYFPMDYRHIDDKISKICIYATCDEHLLEAEKLLPEGYHVTVSLRDPKIKLNCGEVTKVIDNKSTAAQKVLAYYGATLDDAVAIGDSANDIQMIRDCGIGIAMGNASSDVKEVADFVTTDILDNGIENAFKRFHLIGEKQ